MKTKEKESSTRVLFNQVIKCGISPVDVTVANAAELIFTAEISHFY